MSELQKWTVLNQVKLWHSEYSEKILSDDNQKALAKSMFDRLKAKQVTQGQFVWAAQEAGTYCKFFPKTADVMEYVMQYRAHPPTSDQLAIADTTSYHDPTPEESSRNKKRVQICQDAVCGKITWAEAEEMLNPENFA